jgi:DNA-3-methyladenine glycosylase I
MPGRYFDVKIGASFTRAHMMKQRCAWCTDDPIYKAYHDHEWGVPLHDDQALFELLMLEGMQSGLSWLTVLKKREALREAFCHFNPNALIKLSDAEKKQRLKNPSIIRNKLKINAVFHNAHAFLECTKKQSFSSFLWSFVGGSTLKNTWKTVHDVPSKTPESHAMAQALKKNNFKFVGDTTCYAFMQASGMVFDHTVHCFCFTSYRGTS